LKGISVSLGDLITIELELSGIIFEFFSVSFIISLDFLLSPEILSFSFEVSLDFLLSPDILSFSFEGSLGFLLSFSLLLFRFSSDLLILFLISTDLTEVFCFLSLFMLLF
jgi:hypothetical protein